MLTRPIQRLCRCHIITFPFSIEISLNCAICFVFLFIFVCFWFTTWEFWVFILFFSFYIVKRWVNWRALFAIIISLCIIFTHINNYYKQRKNSIRKNSATLLIVFHYLEISDEQNSYKLCLDLLFVFIGTKKIQITVTLPKKRKYTNI